MCWQKLLRNDSRNASNKGKKKKKGDYIKLRNFGTTNETLSNAMRQLTEWMEIFTNHTAVKETIPINYTVQETQGLSGGLLT